MVYEKILNREKWELKEEKRRLKQFREEVSLAGHMGVPWVRMKSRIFCHAKLYAILSGVVSYVLTAPLIFWKADLFGEVICINVMIILITLLVTWDIDYADLKRQAKDTGWIEPSDEE